MLPPVNREDLRSFLIALTDHGNSIADRLDASVVAFEAEIRERVTPEEVAGFDAVMAAVRRRHAGGVASELTRRALDPRRWRGSPAERAADGGEPNAGPLVRRRP